MQKIIWRFKFLAFQSWGKSVAVINLSLKPEAERVGNGLMAVLHKAGIIDWNGTDFFKYGPWGFYYAGMPPGMDIISILAYENVFLKKNFFKNSIYILEGPYEKEGVQIQKDDYIIDVGANLGLFSMWAAQKASSGGKVFAFEPVKATAQLLRKNINFNRLDNIEVVEKALGRQEGSVNLSVSESLGESSNHLKEDVTIEAVTQTTLDNYVKQNGIAKIDMIKADIEGMERELLAGAEQTIKKFKPKLSICIYHLPDDPDVIRSMIKGFVPQYNILQTDAKLFAWL